MIVLGSLKAEKRIQAEYPHVEENTKHFAEIAKHLSKLGSVMLLDCMTEKDIEEYVYKKYKTSVYKGYKQDKIEMRGDRAEMSDFPLYLNTVAGGLDRRDQTIGGFSFVVKIYAVPVIEIIG